MDRQQSVQPFTRQMPPMPANVVSTRGSSQALLDRESRLAKSPVKADKTSLTNGRVYYGYYCAMCHGDKGDGQTPVGLAYVPKASDLKRPDLGKLTDGQLYRRMLTGPGHDPVMQKTVFPDQRWPIVLYVRTFTSPQ